MTCAQRQLGRSAVLCVVAAVLATASAFATLPVQPATNPVVVGGDQSYAPYHFIDPSGAPAGFDVDMFRALSEQAGLQPTFALGDWSAALTGLESGAVDVVPMFVSAERRARFLFSKPFLSRHHLVFGRRGIDFVDDLGDLAGHRVAVQFGGLAWEVLSEREDVGIVPVAEEGKALAVVANGRADYALVPMMIGYHARKQLKLGSIVALSSPLLTRDYAFAVAPSRPELVNVIDDALKRVSQNGQQDAFYERWLANLTRPEDSYRSGLLVGIWLIVPLLGLIALFVRYWRAARRSADAEAASRREAEARSYHLAFHDAVTGLMNRNGLRSALNEQLSEGGRWVIVRLDLLDVGSVEAIAGQEFVERLLKAVACRLTSLDGAALVATVGRRGFDVVFRLSDDGWSAESACRSSLQAVQQTIELDGVPIDLTCRAGLALFPEDALTPDRLLRAAGVACAAAHQAGARDVRYSAELEPDPRNLTLLSDLRDAIREGSLGYAIQPKMRLGSSEVVGGELLVRWQHPRYGAMPPSAFVPLAERTGVVSEMTAFLIAEAAGLCRRWLSAGARGFTLAINVSVNDLADMSVVDAIIDSADGVGEHLILEVTETSLMRQPEQVIRSVAKLRKAGLRISLDDFGTGHSSLVYLRQLAPDEVKIDRSFISSVLESHADQAIVRSMIELAHSLSAHVTAEGIEDDETIAWLASAGCDLAQGFGIARPLPIDTFESLIVRG